MAVARYLYVMALIVWIGSIVFFSFAVAPVVFQVLPREQAGALTSAAFPIYYAVGCGCGLVLLLSCLLLRGSALKKGLWTGNATVIAGMFALTLYAAVSVQPRATALRPQLHGADASSEAKQEFDRLHRLAVMLNGAVLVGGLLVTGVTASSLRP